MRKFLSLLSTIGVLTLSTSAGTGLLNFNQTSQVITTNNYNKNLQDKYENNWQWNNVKINHSTATPREGTHVRDDKKSKLSAVMDISWADVFMKSNDLIANGYFALHTYSSPRFLNSLVLKLKSSDESNGIRVWQGGDENDQWRGWGHHLSKIYLTVTVQYDFDSNLAALSIESYIYARTAGAVHECSTTSQVQSVKFIVD